MNFSIVKPMAKQANHGFRAIKSSISIDIKFFRKNEQYVFYTSNHAL